MLLYDGHKVYTDGKYPAIYIKNRNYHLHRYVWEKYNGKIPKGYIIHHKDENKMNYDISNLELLSRREHIKKHKGVVKRHGIKLIAWKGKNRKTFSTLIEACKYCKTYSISIERCLNGKQYQTKGWRFKRR